MKNLNESLQLEATVLEKEGHCQASEGNYAIYGALPNETVVARPIARKSRRLFVRTESVENPHPDRVVPDCSAAAYCGGCVVQHVSHNAQVAFKEDRLRNLFSELSPAEWLTPLTDSPFNYRAKARLGVKYVEKKGRMLVGFREKHKPFIAETERCSVLREPVGSMVTPLADLILSLSCNRSVPQVEVAVGDSETALVFRHLDALTDADITTLTRFGETHDASIWLQPGSPDTVHRIYPTSGEERLSYTVGDVTLKFHPLDFTQVNAGINRKMVQLALNLLAIESGERIFDAFCGIGNFSLPMARAGAAVSGLELSETSVQRARNNARDNGLNDTEFGVADLFNAAAIPDLTRFDKVLIDPPRIGAEALCAALANSPVKKVVYVSCKPETLVRDVGLLTQGGFKLEKAGLIDMFPHTAHMESIALLTRPANG